MNEPTTAPLDIVSRLRPRVTAEQFANLECNRCGDCCQIMSFEAPLQQAVRGYPDILAGMRRQPLITTRPWKAPRGANCKTMAGESGEMTPQERWASYVWLAELEPLSDEEFSLLPTAERLAATGQWRYSCPRLAFDETGLGVCTVHDQVNPICSGFPYGLPAGDRAFTRCSFSVVLYVPDEVVDAKLAEIDAAIEAPERSEAIEC